MAIYTARLTRVCAGGGHITVTAQENGIARKPFVLLREELESMTLEDALKGLMWFEMRKARATTTAQIKTAIEAASWEVTT